MNKDGDEMERRAGSRIEQHIGTILQVLVVALLGWSLMTTQNMSKDVEVLKVRVDTLTLIIKEGGQDRYKGADATRDFNSIRQELQYLDRRVQRLEARR